MPLYYENTTPGSVGTTVSPGSILPAPTPGPVAGPSDSPVGGNTPNVGVEPTTNQFNDWILNSPRYLQGLENLGSYDTAIARTKELAALQSGYSTGGGGYTQTVPQSFYDQIKLAQEKAAHDYGLAQKALPEIMAGRGMLSSGQTGFEQGEQAYNYDMLLKDLELQKKAREESVAQANAASAASAAASAANARVSQQIQAKQDEYRIIDLNLEKAKAAGTLANSVYDYYKEIWWDKSGNYIGPTFDASGKPVTP